jgi:hypothetical protein
VNDNAETVAERERCMDILTAICAELRRAFGHNEWIDETLKLVSVESCKAMASGHSIEKIRRSAAYASDQAEANRNDW